MADHVTITYVTTPNKEVAQKLARGLVENRLAACVNIVHGVESIYEWEGKITQDNEILMIIKSSKNKSDKLAKFVEENHPYNCPEVVTTTVSSGSEKYLEWVRQTTCKSVIAADDTQ